MNDLSAERIREANRALLMCLFFAGLTLTTILFISVVVVLAEADVNAGKCEGTLGSSSPHARATKGGAAGVFGAVLADLPQAEDGITYAAEAVQRPVMREGWSQNRLVLVVDYAPHREEACERQVFVATAKETPRELSGKWVTGQPGDRVLLTSFQEADHLSRSLGRELRACGDLIIYGLSQASGSDRRWEQEGRVLSALAELLREDVRLKVRLVGHRASTGDAEADYDNSVSDAKAIKRILVEEFGTEAKRVFAEGVGSEEPIADNDTDTGRAANSRIEVVTERSCNRAKESVAAGRGEMSAPAREVVSLGPGMR